jgi:hypothetical protein
VVTGAVRASADHEVGAAVEDAVQDGLGEVSSWSTWPSAARGLFVVKSIGRRFR